MIIAEDTLDLSAIDTATPAKTATNYITETDENGITVHPEGDTDNYIQLDGNGLNIFRGGENVANYGAYTRIGTADGARTEIDSTSIKLKNEDGATAVEIATGGGSMEIETSDSIDIRLEAGSTTHTFSVNAVSGTVITLRMGAKRTTVRAYTMTAGTASNGTITASGATVGTWAITSGMVIIVTLTDTTSWIDIVDATYTTIGDAPLTSLTGEATLNGNPLVSLPMSDFVKVTSVESGNVSVSSGSHNTGTFTGTMSEAGTWVPIGVTGWRITNGNNGSGYHYATFNHFYVSNAANNSVTVSWRIRAVGGAVSNCHVIAYVLWIRIA